MLFSFTFEIGLLILGFLWVGDMYLDSVINLIQITNEIDKDEKDKQDDEDLKKITKHIYS